MAKGILILFLLMAAGAIFSLNAQEIARKWKTVDDNTGKARSVVEIYQEGDKYFGKVIAIFSEEGEDPDPICDLCEDDRKDQKIIGMQIIRDMEFDKKDNEYSDGEILDPENGNLYDCKLWVEDGNLKVRGYLYFLYRTQTWLPYDE